MDISLKRTGRLLSSEKPAALRHFITSESGLSQVSASKTSWPQEMPRMLWNFSGRNFHTFCQSWTRMLNLHRYNHPNQGARIQWGEVETCWKPQIWAGFIFCVNVWKTIKIGFQATDMVNRSGHLLRTRHEAHRSFHNSWGLALQDANNLLTRHFKELSRSPQFAGMVHAAQRCRSVVSIQIYQLLGSRCGRVTHSRNGLPLHSKMSGRKLPMASYDFGLRDTSHSHRSRCCCWLLLWAMAVVPIAGPKCGSKRASTVHQQPAHGYMILLIPAT